MSRGGERKGKMLALHLAPTRERARKILLSPLPFPQLILSLRFCETKRRGKRKRNSFSSRALPPFPFIMKVEKGESSGKYFAAAAEVFDPNILGRDERKGMSKFRLAW